MPDRKFLLDSMLGTTAKWLRLLGFDAEYERTIGNGRLLDRAQREGRVLLTGDRQLYLKAMKGEVQAFLLEGEDEAERIASLARRYGLDLRLDPDRSRCLLCNVPLMRVERSLLEGRVCKPILERHRRFWTCSRCHRVYWSGSHIRSMRLILRRAMSIARRSGSSPGLEPACS